MNIGPVIGLAASLAGQPLAERQSAEGEQALRNGGAERVASNELKAEAAAGVGAMDSEDKQAHERDADGRQVLSWGGGDPQDDPSGQQHGWQKRSADPDGERGSELDLLA